MNTKHKRMEWKWEEITIDFPEKFKDWELWLWRTEWLAVLSWVGKSKCIVCRFLGGSLDVKMLEQAQAWCLALLIASLSCLFDSHSQQHDRKYASACMFTMFLGIWTEKPLQQMWHFESSWNLKLVGDSKCSGHITRTKKENKNFYSDLKLKSSTVNTDNTTLSELAQKKKFDSTKHWNSKNEWANIKSSSYNSIPPPYWVYYITTSAKKKLLTQNLVVGNFLN